MALKTIGMKSAPSRGLGARWLGDEPANDDGLGAYLTHEDRPRARGDCEGGPRPCPWVSCRYHLALDVNELSGGLKLNHPGVEVWDMPETCALDLADRYHGKGVPLPVLHKLMGLSYDRTFQIVDEAKQHAKQIARQMRDQDDE